MTPRRLKRLARAKWVELKARKSISPRPISVLLLAAVSIVIFSGFATVQNMYIIDDSGNTYIQYTFSSNLDEILRSANLTVSENDIVSYELSGGERHIVIKRAKDVTVIDGDNTYSLVCYGETVAWILSNLGIVLEEDDQTSIPPLSIASGEIYVNRAYTEIDEIEEAIPFETVYYASNSLDSSEPAVIREGQDGAMISYYLVSYTGGGVELSRSFICSEVVREPVDELISVDSAMLSALSGQDTFANYLVEYNEDGGGTITTLSGEVYHFTKTDNFECTAYSCEGYSWRTTFSGTYAEVGVVAVDPSIIPLGTRLFIVSADGEYVYGYCVAEDTGDAVKGKIIDLYFNTVDECWQFGRRNCTVYYVE